MPKEYSVIVSDEAMTDLDDIVDYLSHFSDSVALKYHDLIEKSVADLSFMPARCPFVRDDRLREKGYRWFFVQNYTIFFVIDDINTIVDVRAILYARREYTALL
jgi:toxin ParE1/3/4